MPEEVTEIALIGATASGKSSLALELARKYRALILSLDSLALYREIDIASAKPTRQDRGDIPHYGIDLLTPDEPFDVTRFLTLYKECSEKSRRENRPLIIVGGSSFYLKILLEGISPLPDLNSKQRDTLDTLLHDLPYAYETLKELDPEYAQKISSNDRYRIEKALQIYLSTGHPPSEYFALHPPVSSLQRPIPIFEIYRERSVLRERIRQRTHDMIAQGLIDEVAGLEYRYGRAPHPMKAIGIREVLDYFDGRLSRNELEEKIVIHTARLAKRQETFNRSQFQHIIRGEIETIKQTVEKLWSRF